MIMSDKQSICLCNNAIGYMLQYYMHMEIKQNKTKGKMEIKTITDQCYL